MIWALALILVVCAGWLDWRTWKIPNWLTIPGFLLGLATNAVIGRWPGLKDSLEGAGLALGLLLPLVILRALGAGDWKLMGAMGAFLGPWPFLDVLVVTIFVAGVMGVLQMMRAGRVMATVRNLVLLVKGFFTFGLRSNPEISLDNPGLLRLPFGVAAAAGTLICYLASRGLQ